MRGISHRAELPSCRVEGFHRQYRRARGLVNSANRNTDEKVYQNGDTEPQPKNGAPRRRGRLDPGGEADGPNGGRLLGR